MTKSKVVMLSVMFLNTLYNVYSEGIKPVFTVLFNLIKVIFSEILKPVSMYVYTLISNIFTYDYSNIISTVKETFSNFISYFKEHSFNDIFNDLIIIKNIIVIVTKQLLNEYKEGANIVSINSVDTATLVYTRRYIDLTETCTFNIQTGDIEVTRETQLQTI